MFPEVRPNKVPLHHRQLPDPRRNEFASSSSRPEPEASPLC